MSKLSNDALQSLSDELNRTAVLSPIFKEHIMQLAISATTIAYNAGRKDAANANREAANRDIPYTGAKGQGRVE